MEDRKRSSRRLSWTPRCEFTWKDRKSFSCDVVSLAVVTPPRPISLRILAAEKLRDSRFRSSDHVPLHPRERQPENTFYRPTHYKVTEEKRESPRAGGIIQFGVGNKQCGKSKEDADPGVVNGRLGLKH